MNKMQTQNTKPHKENALMKVEQKKSKGLMKSANHHDKFFKRFFSILSFAKELVQLMFSKTELTGFDLSSLRVEKDTWTHKLADLVLSLPLKDHPDRRFMLFILLEHKSTYDPFVWSQLLLYQTGLYDHTRKQGWPLMPIVPAVFYHGNATWKWQTSFQEGLWGNALKKLGKITPFVINYRIKLLSTHDLRLKRAMKDKQLKSRAVLNLMAKIWNLKNSPEELKKVVALFGDLADEREDFVLYVLEYLKSMNIVTAKSWGDLEKELVLEGTFKKGGFMDIREEIRQEGRQEGMEKERQAVVLNMLQEKVDMSLICKVTGLAEEEIKKLKNGSCGK